MRNESTWRPTKFESTSRGWRGSRNPRHLAVSSRLSADLVLRRLAAHLREHARGHLLDLGCGNAPLYGLYREQAARITCVDWTSSPHESRYVDAFANLNQGLPFTDRSFDTILCTSVLEHIQRPDRLWNEIGRILAPRGKLILSVPFLYPLHEIPHDYFRYTEFRLRQYCLERMLSVLTLETYGGLPEVLCLLAAKRIEGWRRGCRLFTRLCNPVLEKRMDRRSRGLTGRRWPLGYCLVAERPAVGSPEEPRRERDPPG